MATSNVSSEAASVFDMLADTGSLDWGSVYFYVGLAASAACEAVEHVQLLGRVHPRVEYDPRVVGVLADAKALRETLQQLAATAYTRGEGQNRGTQE